MYACIDWILPGNSDLLFAKILGWNKNWIPALYVFSQGKTIPIGDKRQSG